MPDQTAPPYTPLIVGHPHGNGQWSPDAYTKQEFLGLVYGYFLKRLRGIGRCRGAPIITRRLFSADQYDLEVQLAVGEVQRQDHAGGSFRGEDGFL